MKNVKMIIEFEGTNYSGWQYQPDEPSIQSEIEQRIIIITNEHVRVNSSGRTDAGVHAKKMVANFFIDKELDLGKFMNSMNALLPVDICIIDIEYAPESFHSRKSAKKKIYEYQILNRDSRSPFLDRFAWHIRKPLDIKSITKASKFLLGEHDFRGFTSQGTDVSSYVRTIYDIDIEKEGDILLMTFTGNGFLKQMIRNIVGLLVQIGQGRFSPDYVDVVLVEKQIKKRYITAPARGLFLKDVIY